MVDIVASERFFDQSTMQQIAFTNAQLIQDHFHLFNSGLQKMFGKVGYELLKSQFIQMIRSKTASIFDEIYNSGLSLLSSEGQMDG